MDMKKLAPWNWLKEEEASHSTDFNATPDSHRQTSAVARMYDRLDQMFDELVHGSANGRSGKQRPATDIMAEPLLLRPKADISASDNAYTISVETPGVEEKDIQLELMGSTLTISGEKKRAFSDDTDERYYRIERSYGAFQRILSLPSDADLNGIEANFSNGVLKVRLPRIITEKQKGKMIEISTAA